VSYRGELRIFVVIIALVCLSVCLICVETSVPLYIAPYIIKWDTLAKWDGVTLGKAYLQPKEQT